MANPWWTGQVGQQGMESTSGKPDLGISMSAVSRHNEDEDQENSDDPHEGAIEPPSRRPRGRPPGSKNKPKPPIFVTRDSPNTLRSHIMEVADGADVVESIANFARRRQRGVCVMSANGTVTGITIREPTAAAPAAVAIQGQFEILSLTGAFLPEPLPSGSTGLTVYVSNGQGRVIGGFVVGPLIAVGPVMVIAATFSNATYERLPLEEQEEEARHQHHHHNNNNNNHVQLSGGPGSPLAIAGPQHGIGGGVSSALAMYNMTPNMMINGGGSNGNGGGQLGHEAYGWNNNSSNHGVRPPFQ